MMTNEQIAALPNGTHGVGYGVYIRVRGKSISWMLRYKEHGRTRTVSLGIYPGVDESHARQKAAAIRPGPRRTEAVGIDLAGVPTRYYWTVPAFIEAHGPLQRGEVGRLHREGVLRMKWWAGMCFITEESAQAWRATHGVVDPDDPVAVKILAKAEATVRRRVATTDPARQGQSEPVREVKPEPPAPVR